MQNKVLNTVIVLITLLGTITCMVTFFFVWQSYSIANYNRGNAYQIMMAMYTEDDTVIATYQGEKWQINGEDFFNLGKILTPPQPDLRLTEPVIESDKGITVMLPTGTCYYVAPHIPSDGNLNWKPAVIWRRSNNQVMCLVTEGFDTYNRLLKIVKNGKKMEATNQG